MHRSSWATRWLATAVTTFAVAFTGVIVAAPAAAVTGGVVSGIVTFESTPGNFTPIANASVVAYPLFGAGDVAGGGTTNALGEYSISNLSQGDYHLVFFLTGPTQNQLIWLGNTPYEAGSEILTVGAGAVTGVNAALPKGSTISGHITVNGSSAGPNDAAAAVFLWDPVAGQFQRFSWRATTTTDGAYTISGVPEGEYILRFGRSFDDDLLSTEYWEAEDYLTSYTPVVVGADVALTGFDGSIADQVLNSYRIAGDDRYGTSAAIAGGWDSAETVFIVNGLNFPDALSAGPIAGLFRAPLLLVGPTSIPSVVAEELTRLSPDTIIIIGGTGAVSAGVETALGAYAPNVDRLQGTDRYATSRAVAGAWSLVGSNRTAYLATGANFPDALASGPAAINEGYGPVILVNGSATSLDTATRDLLEDLGITKVVIAGGPASFSNALETSLRGLDFLDEVYRRSGTGRYDTAVKVNQKSFPFADAVFLATGTGFPDALSGTALAGLYRAPIFLVQPNCVPVDVLEEINFLQPAEIYLLGGPGTLSAAVAAGVPC